MSETKWESGPWHSEVKYNGLGFVQSVHVIASKNREVTTFVFSGMKRNRVGQLEPTTDAKTTESHSSQPAVVANCGIPYAGLASETLVANGDLIAAAPELYEALELLVKLADRRLMYLADWDGEDGLQSRCDAALAKARGESA